MTQPKILGVIEGFYGAPWSHADRLACIDDMASWGWNTYVWAAKLEPRHREQWNEPFTDEELECFAELSHRSSAVQVAVGLTPGDNASEQQVINKLLPAIHAGCKVVVLCFDDLPVLHAAQSHQALAHATAEAFGVPVWIVPTHYAGINASDYLTALCTGLRDDIEVMWTGDTVVTDSITAPQSRERSRVTGGRLPLIWDNTPVNDARMRAHLHMGPLMGRDPELLSTCSGFLWNPMEEFAASRPTLCSAAAWSRGENEFTAWEQYVESRGLRALAEATAYRGDTHWPGDSPSHEWWQSVAEITCDDPQLLPWVEAAQEGARLALAALSVVNATEELSAKQKNVVLFQFMGWGAHQSRTHKTFGAGPRTRPVATQDEAGRFVLLPASIEESPSLVDGLVRQALAILNG